MVNVKGLYDDKDQLLFLSSLTASNSMMGFIFWIGVVSGLRISDILKLKISDLTFSTFKVTENKTKKEKWITLPDDCFLQLSNYILKLKSNGRLDSSPLFPVTRQTVHKYFTETATILGFTLISPHSMRKTFA